MSHHPLKLWTASFLLICIITFSSILFQTSILFVTLKPKPFASSASRNQPLWVRMALCQCPRQRKKQATVEPFQPYHKGFYTTATIDRTPSPKGCLPFLSPLAAEQRQSRYLGMHWHINTNRRPPGLRGCCNSLPLSEWHFQWHLQFCSIPLVFSNKQTCVSGLPLKSSESPSIR